MRGLRRIRGRSLWASLAAFAVLAVLASAAPAAVTPALKAVAAPSTAHAGDVVSLALTLRNLSRRPARHVVVAVTLVPAAGTTPIRVRSTKIAVVRARAQTTARTAVTIPATGAPASFTLHVCIANRCRDTRPIGLLAGDSYDRITSALAAGKLSLGKAALYELQADANSPAVPSAYRNTAPGGPDTPGLIALQNWNGLSTRERAALVPYFLPPTYAQSVWAPRHGKTPKRASVSGVSAVASSAGPIDSILNFLDCTRRPELPAGDWSVTASSGDVVIHANDLGDSPLVKYLAGQVPLIWATLVSNDHFPAPLSDASCDVHGDGRLDVYLLPGSAMPHGVLGLAPFNGCGASSSYILINKDQTARDVAMTLAHEFFHAEQAATGVICRQPEAWVEGAAMWAIDEVYPYSHFPHDWPQWSNNPTQAMQTLSYSAWPFWYWLRHEYGSAKIATLFSTLKSEGFDAAVRLAPGVNFVDAFRDFAADLWNQNPDPGGDFPRSFAFTDQYYAAPEPLDTELKLGGATGGPTPDTYRSTVNVPPLSISYVEFTTDSPVKQLTIDNGFAQQSDVGVDLYADTSSESWKRINLTTTGEKSFCENKPGEDVSHGIIAISNSSETARSANIDLIVGTRCKPGIEFDGTWKCDTVCAGAGTDDWDWTGNADLQIDPQSPATEPIYDVTGGSVTVNVHGTTPDPNSCTFSGTTTVPLNAGHDTVSLALIDQPPSYEFSVELYNEPITVTYGGCDNPPPPAIFPIETVPFTYSPGPLARDPSASELEYSPPDTPEAPGQAAQHEHWKIGL